LAEIVKEKILAEKRSTQWVLDNMSKEDLKQKIKEVDNKNIFLM